MRKMEVKYCLGLSKMAKEHGIEFTAPPHRNAAEHINMYHYQIYDKAKWAERNEVIRRCEEKGIEGWKKEAGYNRRSIVENSFYRLKRIFGSSLKSRREEGQYREQCIRASLINRFNRLGLPKYAV
jgi:transposase